MKRVFSILTLTAVFAIAMFSFFGCSGDDETVISVNGVTIVVSPPVTGATLTVGDTHTITVTVTPDNATDKDITLTSNAAAISVTPTQTGWTMKAESEGQATLTATAKDGSGKSASLTFTVIVPVEKVTITDKQSSFFVGDKYPFKAEVLPENAANKTVTWVSSNPSVATVDAATGLVTAISPGTAVITATADGISDECEVEVKPVLYV